MAKRYKAIPTKFKGIQYKSRAEARWAVFFDSLGLDFEYEPRTFPITQGGYCPDFHMDSLPGWIEIKGRDPWSEEYEKAQGVARMTGENVYFLIGSPRLGHGLGNSKGQGELILADPSVLRGHLFDYVAGGIKRALAFLDRVSAGELDYLTNAPQDCSRMEDIYYLAQIVREFQSEVMQNLPFWLIHQNPRMPVSIGSLHWRNVGDDVFLDYYDQIEESFGTDRLFQAYHAAWDAFKDKPKP